METSFDRYYAESYREARARFREAASKIKAQLHSYSISESNDLTMDVALVGPPRDSVVLVSSGVHGVEGFLGSAIQLAILDRLAKHTEPRDVQYALVHAVNPYGFEHVRRFNEDNVDLNRNFLSKHEKYPGSPPGYAALNGLLNPASAPSRWEPFKLKAMWNIWRLGLQPIKNAIAGGQYDYPNGIFFGGSEACSSTKIIQANCDCWLRDARRVVHIDFHTGLGAIGSYKLLLTETQDSKDVLWYENAFGAEFVEPFSSDGTAYVASGLFGSWMQQHFRTRSFAKMDYRYVAAEFGTYDVIRVLAAIRAENRAHHFADPQSTVFQKAKQELKECFCPASTEWRRCVMTAGLQVVRQAETNAGC